MIPDTFNPTNVTDTCAVWHLVGADTLFRTARRVNVSFILTPTVLYECFVKKRTSPPTEERLALRARLQAHLDGRRISEVGMSIEDLQETMIFAKRHQLEKRIGQGELSCVALARHLGHAAVLTDNKRDFAAIGMLVDGRLQKTPQLLGWLLCEGHLTDSDVDEVVREHEASGGQMAKILRTAYEKACEKRLMSQFAQAKKEHWSG